MATYEILTQQTLANIINTVVPGTYIPSVPRKAMSYDEVIAVKNNIASVVNLTVNNFIKNNGDNINYTGRQLVQKVSIIATEVAPTNYTYTVKSKAYGATVLINTVHPVEDTIIPGTPLGFDDDNNLKSVVFESENNGTYLATIKENTNFRWNNYNKSSIAQSKLNYGGWTYNTHNTCISLPINENVYLKIKLEHITGRFADEDPYYLTKENNIYVLHLNIKSATRTLRNNSVNISGNGEAVILPGYDDVDGGIVDSIDSITDYTTKYVWPDGTETRYEDKGGTMSDELELYNTEFYQNTIRLLPIISNPTAGKIPIHRLSVFVNNYLYPKKEGRVFSKEMNNLSVFIKRTSDSVIVKKSINFTVNIEIDSEGYATPVLYGNFTENVGPTVSQMYVTGTVVTPAGTYTFTITPTDNVIINNKNYYGNFDIELGANKITVLDTIGNLAIYNFNDIDWEQQLYAGIIRQN